MKLIDILDQYHQDSGQASDIARNINYALLGVVWILSREEVSKLVSYKLPLILIVLSLFADFLQYFVKGILEKRHFDKQEKKARSKNGDIYDDFEAEPYPCYIKKIAISLYYLKLISTAGATFFVLYRMYLNI